MTYWNVKVLCDSSSGFAKHAKGERLVQEQSELVLFLQLDLRITENVAADVNSCLDTFVQKTYNPWQIDQNTRILKDTFCNNEPSLQRSSLPLGIPLNALQHALQILHIIRLEPLDRRPRNLHALLDPKVDGLVDDDNVASFGKGRNDGGSGGECLGVDDGGFLAYRVCEVILELCVDV